MPLCCAGSPWTQLLWMVSLWELNKETWRTLLPYAILTFTHPVTTDLLLRLQCTLTVNTDNMRTKIPVSWTYVRWQQLCQYDMRPPHAECNLHILLGAELLGNWLETKEQKRCLPASCCHMTTLSKLLEACDWLISVPCCLAHRHLEMK